MARTNPRATVAAPIFRLAEKLAALRAEARHAIRLTEDDQVGELLLDIEQAECRAFSIADRIERGEVTIEERGQEDRPLFDRPAKPVVEVLPQDEEVATRPGVRVANQPAMVSQFPPLTELNRCNRCNALRLRSVAVCPKCSSPEYALTVIDHDGEVVPQPIEEAVVKPEKAKKPKRAKLSAAERSEQEIDKYADQFDPETGKAKQAEPQAGPTIHRYDVWLAADGEEERQWIGEVYAHSVVVARTEAEQKFKNEYMPGAEFEVSPSDDRLGEPIGNSRRVVPIRECVSCGHRWPQSQGIGCPICIHGPVKLPQSEASAPTKPRTKRKEAALA